MFQNYAFLKNNKYNYAKFLKREKCIIIKSSEFVTFIFNLKSYMTQKSSIALSGFEVTFDNVKDSLLALLGLLFFNIKHYIS